MIEPFLKEKEIDPEVLAKFIQSQQSQQSQRKRVSRNVTDEDIPMIGEDFRRPAVKPYFTDEDDDSSLPMVADDSEV